MSISNQFAMKTGRTTYEVVDLLAENLPFVEYVTTEEDLASSANKFKDIFTTNKALNFTVMDGTIGRENIENVFGFTPDVKLLFEMSKTPGQYEISHTHMLQTIIWLLEHLSGDAVFFFGHTECTGMHRKEGKISLSNKERKNGNWRDIDLANFTLPYEWADLPEPH